MQECPCGSQRFSRAFPVSAACAGAASPAAKPPPAYYARWGNPTVRELEDALADLEGGARGLATASGMGAIASAILACGGSGDHVVAGASLYTSTAEIFTRMLPRFRG